MNAHDTIAAIATAPGYGGVGIVRVSGNECKKVALALLGELPQPRLAVVKSFIYQDELIDSGLVLYFKSPHSFTGEDVLEFQGHGGPVILNHLLNTILKCGVRLARPGEFSERAFLNGKIDLAQAEAIADLINASTLHAAKSAQRSLQGEFSKHIELLAVKLMHARMMTEAAIDFPEEEIDFLKESDLKDRLHSIEMEIKNLLKLSQQGQLLRDGLHVAIIGQPNAGKSSLLNRLTKNDTAIVTPIAGTTRDLIKETIHLDGLPIHLIDTAGIRDNTDEIESEGIKRAHKQMTLADIILLMVDATQTPLIGMVEQALINQYPDKIKIIVNKIDLNKEQLFPVDYLCISAKTSENMENLARFLKELCGYQTLENGQFLARTRHVNALTRTLGHCQQAQLQFKQGQGELMAQELQWSHDALGDVVGKTSSDELLGEIFSQFCIGK